jgi:hypothetical protein
LRKIPLKKTTGLENPKTIHDYISKPVRKVINNAVSQTGEIPSAKSNRMISYESSIEADFAQILEFDDNVARYIEQPIKIPYIGVDGESHNYTPDFIAYYNTNLTPGKYFPTTLFEVKPIAHLKKRAKEFEVKFSAAKQFAEEKSWRFQILTEHEIRTPFLENAKFFLRYKYESEMEEGLIPTVLDTLEMLKEATPWEIIVTASSNMIRRGQLLYALWYLVANGYVGCNFNEKITMHTVLWHKTTSMYI